MENKILKAAKAYYFIVVAIMMYYFLNEQINVGLSVTYRHAFALLLFGSATVLFLYKPNIARGYVAFREACIYSIPLLIVTAASLFVWFMETVSIDVISRGISSTFVYTNMLSAALCSGALLYVFGSRGIWYNLICILAANLLMIMTIIAQNGIGPFFSEFITLLVTFANETGDIIVRAEIHELAFCLGAYLIYMLFKPKKNIVYFILMFLTLFCFLAALKRIAIIAIVIALAVGYALKLIARFSKKTAGGLVIFVSISIIAALVGYIAIIKADTFTILEQIGINTSGRAEIYTAVDKFYEFSPDFIGNGIGFLTYTLNEFMSVGVGSVHNDFLQYFIDLGFWGYIAWLISMVLVRVCYFGRGGNIENAINTLMLMIYLIIVSSTDNTMSYPLLTGVLALLMMGNSFDENVRTCEKKIFGCVSPVNAEKGGKSLL